MSLMDQNRNNNKKSNRGRNSNRSETGKNQTWRGQNQAPKNKAERSLEFPGELEELTLRCCSFYAQNIEFSSFIELLRAECDFMNSNYLKLRERLPFCVFQHVMVQVLYATVFKEILTNSGKFDGIYFLKDKDGTENFKVTERFPGYRLNELLTPGVQFFISNLRGKAFEGRVNVTMNLPEIAIPQGPIAADDTNMELKSGSFGRITAEDHNKYECYISPLVTSELIEQTVLANDSNNFVNWHPLPEGAYPAGAVPNKNLLGYAVPQKLSAATVEELRNACKEFKNDDSYLGRLRYSPKLLSMVSDALQMVRHQNLNYNISFKEDLAASKYYSRAFTAALEVKDSFSTEISFADSQFNIQCLENMESNDICKAFMLGLKKIRNIKNHGVCYTNEGEIPAGWLDSINNNFNMTAPFEFKNSEPSQSRRLLFRGQMPNNCLDLWNSFLRQNFHNSRPRSENDSYIFGEPDARLYPKCRQYFQNIEFSSFIELLRHEYTYLNLIDLKLRNRMPFCVFQHVMVQVLYAYLFRLRVHIMENLDHEYGFAHEYQYPFPGYDINSILLPPGVKFFISNIKEKVCDDGSTISFILPKVGVPQGPIVADGEDIEMESGSFGRITAEDHNKYECYISPLITSKLIEQTILANEKDNFNDWHPLPKGAYPAGAVPNKNLLGYAKPEILPDQSIVNTLKNMGIFKNDAGFLGRMRYNEKIFDMVFITLDSLKEYYKIEGNVTFENNNAFLAIVKNIDERYNMQCPEKLEKNDANKAALLGLKKIRNEKNHGACYTIENNIPDGWLDCINNNYNMVGSFKLWRNEAEYYMNLHEYIFGKWYQNVSYCNFLNANFRAPNKGLYPYY